MASVRRYLHGLCSTGLGQFGSERTPIARVRRVLARLWPQDPGIPLIRIGRDFDGGYLVPDDLAGIAACFSPGVDVHATFEQELARRGMACHLADPSVPGPPPGCEGMSFERRFLGSYDSDTHTTLAAWVGRHAADHAGDLLLQMDIEGAEFDVMPNVDPALLRRFRILVIEFHKLDWIAQPFVCTRMEECFAKLAIDFVPVHLHPNNASPARPVGPLRVPRAVEVTYLRRDRCTDPVSEARLPHPLDRDNVPVRPPIVLSSDWGDRTAGLAAAAGARNDRTAATTLSAAASVSSESGSTAVF